MFAQPDKPRLKLARGTSSEGEAPLRGLETEETRQHNQAILNQLKRRQWGLQFLACGLTFGAIAGFTFFSPTMLAALPSLSWLLGELQAVSQRVILMEALIRAFQREGAKIHSGLSFEGVKEIDEGVREIDFFVAFPDKEFILIQNRSLGNSKVFYNEKTEALQFIRKGGGLNTWEPDPLAELAAQEKALRKTRRDLFGGSSKDQRKPLSKLLVLWSETKLGSQSEQMYDTIGGYLTIRKVGTVNVVEKDQAVNFIRAYLAYRRSSKAP
jgi:hypothetical protein